MARLTEQAIVDSFLELLEEKSLDKITVKDIIESAQVNRNTFYYYFQDIYDLLEHVFQEESKTFRSEAKPENTFYKECLRTVNFFLEHDRAIMHIYHSKSQDVINRYLESATSYFIGNFVDQAAQGQGLSQKGKAYITGFYTDAIIGSTLRWIEGRMPGQKDGLMRTFSQSFEATIHEMIQAYVQGHPLEED